MSKTVVSPYANCSKISPESYLFQANSSLGPKIIRKLKQGNYVLEATLDLHGYILSQAEDTLEEFIQECLEDSLRCVLIIHGKGSQAILKNHVNDYLQYHSQVLAFCSAKSKDGGTGAIYALLKKQHSTGDNCEEK
ncbi:MAG: Smr/MutS family protein [Pseudomonadota bacterium]